MDRAKMMWLVRVYNSNKQQVGPTWEVPSKVKPVRWAQQAHKEYEGYTFMYEPTGLTEREYAGWPSNPGAQEG